MTSPLLESPLLRHFAPYTIAGFAGFRAIIDTDGAVPARFKALFSAVAAIAKNQEDLALRELRRGAAAGLTLKEAVAGLIVLSSLRGEGMALAFEKLLGSLYRHADTSLVPAEIPTAAPGEAIDNFTRYFGAIPAPLAQLLRLRPDGADAYYLMRRGSIDSNPLSPKYGELLLLTILAADYSPMAATHVRGARNAGASDEEIAEALLCAVPAAGIAAWMAAGALLERQAE
jgi:alkylhydroperoxidase/carboxymuconolactone decarboxylase family protein YurZ